MLIAPALPSLLMMQCKNCRSTSLPTHGQIHVAIQDVHRPRGNWSAVWILQCILHRVQNAAAQMLLGKLKFRCAILFLQELDWLLAVFQFQFKVTVICYKAINCLGLCYLKYCLPLQGSACPLWSSDEGLSLDLPPLKGNRFMGTWERAFFVVALQLWNFLPSVAHLALMGLAFLLAMER